ncbi:MAG: PaaI family thioesterase [Desulfosarcinaceae bacterium]|jgi:acyl-coenzyme A thioesterase PaaI-like protein
MEKIAVQDTYADAESHCYGCGRLNSHGLKIKTYWEGDQTVCRYTPQPYHTAIPGYVYGGLIASLIDCHGTGSAAAAAYRQAGREMGSAPKLRFVTASLHVDYLRPTPIDATLELRGEIEEVGPKKVIVAITLFAEGQACAKGRVVAVKVPENW